MRYIRVSSYHCTGQTHSSFDANITNINIAVTRTLSASMTRRPGNWYYVAHWARGDCQRSPVSINNHQTISLRVGFSLHHCHHHHSSPSSPPFTVVTASFTATTTAGLRRQSVFIAEMDGIIHAMRTAAWCAIRLRRWVSEPCQPGPVRSRVARSSPLQPVSTGF